MESYSAAKKQSWLGWFFRGLLILGFGILLTRLVDLQVIKGNYYQALADGNRIRRIPIVAPRGKILARGGEVLVGNEPVKKKIEFSPQEGYKKVEDISGANPDDVITEYKRTYSLGADFAHVSGYLGEVNKDEVGKINPDCPEKGPRNIGSYIGRMGLEQEYECTLAGTDGEELVEVDSRGQRVRTLGKKEPTPGQDIRTTIDFNLQKKVAEAMDGKKGAAVVSDPQGEILAMYSSPSFDPNIFVNKGNQDKIAQLLNDPDLPFFNRAIGGTFHPGSVFKPLVAIAALEDGKIDKDYTFNDEGQITVKTPYGNYTYNNWYFTQYGGKEGEIGISRAITRSTDTFFYKIGELVGPDEIAKWADTFNLDKKTNIDLPGEVAGLIPTPKWKEETKGEQWFLGNTYHMAIGQGDVAVTPLEVNTETSVIATNGKLCLPGIVKGTTCKDLNLEQKNIDLVKTGMVGACSSGGTGYTFFDFKPQVACKTGTAETGAESDSHAWFTVFGPVNNPQIVTTVLVEKGGEGSKVAGPIATDIFKYWFGVDQNAN